MKQIRYNHAVVGGTFDHLHAGHRQLIETAFQNAEMLTIGITTSSMNKDKTLSVSIEPYYVRKRNIEQYIKQTCNKNSYAFMRLNDVYGISISDPSIDSIIVSRETENKVHSINAIRIQNKLKPLAMVSIPTIYNEGNVISSTNIRLGLTDREGNRYLTHNHYVMPQKARDFLQHPFGKLIRNSPTIIPEIINTIKKTEPPMVFSIGDITTLELLKHNVTPSIAIVDFTTQRNITIPANSYANLIESYKNPAGFIYPNVTKCIEQSVATFVSNGKPITIPIEGEEDLLTLPILLLAPLNSIVLYGLLDKGVVFIKVTEHIKQKTKDILNIFNVI